MTDPTAWVPAHDAQWILRHQQEALAELFFDTTGDVLKDAALAKLLTECYRTCIFRSTLRDAVKYAYERLEPIQRELNTLLERVISRRWAHGGNRPLTDYYVETLEPNRSWAPPEYPALSMMWLLGATHLQLAERLAELTVARAIWETVAVNVRADWNNVNRMDVEQRRMGRPGYAGHVDVGILDRVGGRRDPAQQAAVEAAGREGGAEQGGQTGAVQQNPAAAVGPNEDWRLFNSPEPGQPGHSPQVPMLEVARPNRSLPPSPKVEDGSSEEAKVKIEAEAEDVFSSYIGDGARLGIGAGAGAGAGAGPGALARQPDDRRSRSPRNEAAGYRGRD